MLITFSGVDGAGKSTLIAWLRATLEEQGHSVAVLHMNDDIGVYAYVRRLRNRLLRMLGRAVAPPHPTPLDPPSVPQPGAPRLRRVLRRVRYALVWSRAVRRCVYPIDLLIFALHRLYLEKLTKRVLLMDRYFYDTLVDLSNGGPRHGNRLLEMLTPTPDLPVLLDVPPERAYGRKGEYSVDYLARRWTAYQAVFGRVAGCVRLPNTEPEAARARLWEVVTIRQPLGLPAPAPADPTAAPPLRVLMVTCDWPTPDRPRTTQFIKRQAEFLQAAGVAVEVFHFRGGRKLWNYLRAWVQVRRRLARGGYDLVHAQFGQSGLLAFPKRLPLVVTFRGSDLLGIVSDTDGRPSRVGRLLQRLSRFVAARADAVIVVSEHMKAALPEGVAAHVVPSGLDLALFRPLPQDAARRRLQLPLGARLVLFVGRPHQARKRCELARRAVELVSRSVPAELVVAWGVPHAEIPYYMSACDVLVCTSLQEGSPNAVKEALACNLPVVSVAVGDVAERLRGVEGCELCADDRPETIAAGLERVLRRGGRVNGRDAVRPLDEALLTTRVTDIYRSVLPDRAAGAVLVREATPEEQSGWDELLRRFPNHRVVHTRAWIDSLEACGKGRPLYLVFEKHGEIVGCLPGLVARLGWVRLFGSPLPGWQSVSMGPVFDPLRLSTRELIAALGSFLESRHRIDHIELMSSELDHEAMRGLGFHGEPMPSHRTPLYPRDEPRALRALKDSARRNVERAIKLGLVVRWEDDERFVDEHYDQIKEVFTRRGNSVPFSRQRVLEFFRHMKAAGKLLAVSVSLPDGGPSIATGAFTMDDKELLLWMWAHRTRYRWYRPTELMTWTAMQRAMAAGCEVFDLMGRGDFKKSFGATLDPTKYRWVRSRYAWLGHVRDLAQRMYRWQQAVHGRLARLLSPAPGAPRNPGAGAEVTDDAPVQVS